MQAGLAHHILIAGRGEAVQHCLHQGLPVESVLEQGLGQVHGCKCGRYSRKVIMVELLIFFSLLVTAF